MMPGQVSLQQVYDLKKLTVATLNYIFGLRLTNFLDKSIRLAPRKQIGLIHFFFFESGCDTALFLTLFLTHCMFLSMFVYLNCATFL